MGVKAYKQNMQHLCNRDFVFRKFLPLDFKCQYFVILFSFNLDIDYFKLEDKKNTKKTSKRTNIRLGCNRSLLSSICDVIALTTFSTDFAWLVCITFT